MKVGVKEDSDSDFRFRSLFHFTMVILHIIYNKVHEYMST